MLRPTVPEQMEEGQLVEHGKSLYMYSTRTTVFQGISMTIRTPKSHSSNRSRASFPRKRRTATVLYGSTMVTGTVQALVGDVGVEHADVIMDILLVI